MTMGKKQSHFKKKYQNLKFKDDFMFGVVMSDIRIAKKSIKCDIGGTDSRY